MSGNPPPGFQWDEEKNRINFEKHGLDFQEAVRIFEKPTLNLIDNRRDYGEVRTNSLGDLDGQVIANVTHTDRDGETRLISARLAKEAERERYWEFERELLKEKALKRDPWDKLREVGRKQREAEPQLQSQPEQSQERTLFPDYSQGRERKKPGD